VVALLHPPEDPSAVEKCVALAEGLVAEWRQAVGGQFEVVLEGSAGVHLATLFVSLAARVFEGELTGPWQASEPIRLKRSLTREDAEAFRQTFRGPMLWLLRPHDPATEVHVRPMGAAAPTLFAPNPDE
jgi:hypothetical protein